MLILKVGMIINWPWVLVTFPFSIQMIVLIIIVICEKIILYKKN
jgi:hypothetical protein